MESRTTRSAGGIVLGDSGTIALVQSKATGVWMFPKGHLDPGETDEEAARREILEEAGLANLELLDDLGEYQRPRMSIAGRDDASEWKTIRMFLFAAEPHAALAPTMEMQDAAWVPLTEVASRIASDKDRVWFSTVFERVRQAIQRD